MQNEKELTYKEMEALREARRKYAAASVVKRYEVARKLTGKCGAERVASLNLSKLINQ